MATNSISYNNYFIDPESLIQKSEIINTKIINENMKKNLEHKYENNDDIIEIDTDTEDSSNSFQSQFEKVVNKSEVTLQILKEVPHDDKENISSKSFNEFGKKRPGRPKEIKPKKCKIKKITKEKYNSLEPSTAPKTFNISLGFLSTKSKAKSKKSHDKSKKSENCNIINPKNHIIESKSIKKRGKRPQKILPVNNKNNNTENVLITNDNEKLVNDISDNENPSPQNTESSIDKKEIEDQNTLINEPLPIKKKRGRPFKSTETKKMPGQKGRPLSNGIIEIAPKKRRGRPFLNKLIHKKKYDKPGRPSLGLKKIKKYDKRGRPPGPPKPIKIPGKRGPKPNPNSPLKKPKIPGRGRGRPSFATLKALKENEIKTEIEIRKHDSNSSTTKNEIACETENHVNISDESDEDEVINNSTEQTESLEHKNAINCNLFDSSPASKEEIHNNERPIEMYNEIETISLTSTDSSIGYNNKEISNVENTNSDDGAAYYTITGSNFAKVAVQLEYMIHGKEAILRKHYS